MTPNFEQITEQVRALPIIEKQALRQLLDDELTKIADEEIEVEPTLVQDEKRRLQIEWLKAHRNEYANQYVALDGDVLVGSGATIREAHEQARAKGIKNAFLVRVFTEETVVSAGL